MSRWWGARRHSRWASLFCTSDQSYSGLVCGILQSRQHENELAVDHPQNTRWGSIIHRSMTWGIDALSKSGNYFRNIGNKRLRAMNRAEGRKLKWSWHIIRQRKAEHLKFAVFDLPSLDFCCDKVRSLLVSQMLRVRCVVGASVPCTPLFGVVEWLGHAHVAFAPPLIEGCKDCSI